MAQYIAELKNPAITQMGVKLLSEFYRTLSVATTEEVGLVAYCTGDNSPFLNVVFDTQSVVDNFLEKLVKLVDFLQERNVPWSYLATPLAADKSVSNLGFTLLEETPSMYLNLTNVNRLVLSTKLNYQKVTTIDDLQKWLVPLQEAFPAPDADHYFYQRNADLLSQGELRLQHYIGFYQDEIVACGSIFTDNKAAILHNIGVTVAQRNQGFGTEMTQHLINEVRKLNTQHCFLDSSAEAVKLYQKIGFKIYTSLRYYRGNNIGMN